MSSLIRSSSLVVLAAALAGCGGSVDSDATGGSAGTGATGGIGGGTGATGGAGGSGGAVGGAGGIGGLAGSGGVIGCGHTTDQLEVKVEPDNALTGPTCAAAGGKELAWEQQGRVVKTEKNTFVLDTCPPNADCIAMMTYVSISAKDLELWLPQNAFVNFKYVLEPAWGGCTYQVSIRNLPSWGGEANSVSQKSTLYLAGTDGVLDNPDAGLSVSTIALGCGGGSTGCGEAEDYKLLFNVGPGDKGTEVGMGQTQTVYAADPLRIHNLRSYESGYCDDYWNYAWWAAWLPTSM